jgi:hypothetical protein
MNTHRDTDQRPGAPTTVPDQARDILERFRGMPIPYAKGMKHPVDKAWPTWRFTLDDIPTKFPSDGNLGQLNGYGNFHDGDIDAPEALILAPCFMPPTEFRYGRKSKPSSHWGYWIHPAIRTIQLRDPCRHGSDDHTMLLELRGLKRDGTIGLQSTLPPSTHPSGEMLRWDRYGNPAEIPADLLIRRIHELGAASLLARYWPSQGNRDHAAMALAAGLLQSGMSTGDAEHFIRAVTTAAGDDEVEKRVATVRETAEKIAAKCTVVSWGTFATCLGESGPRVVRTCQKWLKVRTPLELPNGDDAFEKWESPDGTYLIRRGQFFRVHATKDVAIEIPLSNFVARITEDIIHDDGAEERRAFVLDGRLASGRSLLLREVSAAHFDGLGWLPQVWGPEPAALPGQRDHLPYVIRLLSGEVPCRTIFGHLGWRRLGDTWVYLYSGGAVGTDNDIEVDVSRDRLSRYTLPTEVHDVREAVRTSIRLLFLGDLKVTAVLFGLPYRSIVCELLPCPVVFPWHGESGTFKSTVAAIVSAHHGTFQTKDDLVGRFEFTDNSLEKFMFLCKDVVSVVDDLNPEHVRLRKEDLERRFSRLVGNVGNLTGRRRLRSDTSTRPEYAPRGVVVTTGEYLPPLAQSRLARMFPSVFTKETIHRTKLTAMQQRLPQLAIAMRAFIEDIQPDFGTLRDRLQERLIYWKIRAANVRAIASIHDRLPENIAHIAIGIELGLAFAVKVSALTEKRSKRLMTAAFKALLEAAQQHGRLMQEERPTQLFLGALAEGLASGRAWLAKRTDGLRARGRNDGASTKLGWIDSKGVYLIPALAYQFADHALSHRGGLQLGEHALRDLLAKDKLLLRSQGPEPRLVTQHRCEGRNERVLHLVAKALDT